MSGNAHPWRDIYSLAAWRRILEQTVRDDPPEVKALTALIGAYHGLPKSTPQPEAFQRRCEALARIATTVEGMLKQPPAPSKAGGSAPKFRADPPSKERPRSLTGVIDADFTRWLESLWRRCGKKRQYLEQMLAFYGRRGWTTSPESSPDKFIRYLNAVDQRRETDTQMHLTAQNRLERIDPYHRSAELSITASRDDTMQIQASELPMSQALCVWLLDNEADDTPFYVWLESHPICTTTPGLDDAFEPDFKSRVKQTRYLTASELPVYAVTIDQGRLICSNGLNTQPLDTMHASGKGFFGSYAFVRTRSGDFYTAPHGSPGAGLSPMHHSSFTQGRKVAAAGMWQVCKGKVQLIDNNTGHYRTDIRHMRELIVFLRRAGVFTDTAKVDDVLGLAARGSARTVEDWLQAAASLDDAHQHKPITKPSGLHAEGSGPITPRKVPMKFTIPDKAFAPGKK